MSNTVLLPPVKARLFIQQLIEDRVKFTVGYTVPGNPVPEPQDEKAGVLIIYFPNAGDNQYLKVYHRAMNNVNHWLGEEGNRPYPHNSTDDYT